MSSFCLHLFPIVHQCIIWLVTDYCNPFPINDCVGNCNSHRNGGISFLNLSTFILKIPLWPTSLIVLFWSPNLVWICLPLEFCLFILCLALLSCFLCWTCTMSVFRKTDGQHFQPMKTVHPANSVYHQSSELVCLVEPSRKSSINYKERVCRPVLKSNTTAPDTVSKSLNCWIFLSISEHLDLFSWGLFGV